MLIPFMPMPWQRLVSLTANSTSHGISPIGKIRLLDSSRISAISSLKICAQTSRSSGSKLAAR